eukprot:4941517-Prymnesium_polylepis.1
MSKVLSRMMKLECLWGLPQNNRHGPLRHPFGRAPRRVGKGQPPKIFKARSTDRDKLYRLVDQVGGNVGNASVEPRTDHCTLLPRSVASINVCPKSAIFSCLRSSTSSYR